MKNQNNEKFDLYNLVHSLNGQELRKVRSILGIPITKKSGLYKNLFECIKKQSVFNAEAIKIELNLSKETFRNAKFNLLKLILKHLKTIDTGCQKHAFLNDLIELRILLTKGLYKKASRKYKLLMEQAADQHSFNMVCELLRLSDALILFEASEDDYIEKQLKRHQEYNYNCMLSKNLNDYEELTIKILGLAFEMTDSRLEQKKVLLNLLNDPLLSDESKAKSDLAKHSYYESKCLIYMGANDYKNASKCALNCWNHLKRIQSPHRNDFHRRLTILSNYLHSTLLIGDYDAYHKMVPHFENILLENQSTLSLVIKAKRFAMRTSVLLTYYGTTQRYNDFVLHFDDLENQFQLYEDIIHPNFKASIIYYIARLFFIGGDLEKSLLWSNKLVGIQRLNPYHTMLACNNMLRIMIHFDLGNLTTIPYLSKNAKYYIKSKNRYFELERCFINGITKVKAFHNIEQKQVVFKNLLQQLETLLVDEENKYINRLTGIKEWVKSKVV